MIQRKRQSGRVEGRRTQNRILRMGDPHRRGQAVRFRPPAIFLALWRKGERDRPRTGALRGYPRSTRGRANRGAPVVQRRDACPTNRRTLVRSKPGADAPVV